MRSQHSLTSVASVTSLLVSDMTEDMSVGGIVLVERDSASPAISDPETTIARSATRGLSS